MCLRGLSSTHTTSCGSCARQDGSKIKYNKLLTTIPLDITLTWLGKADLAQRLTYSSSHIIGLGLRGQNPHDTKVMHITASLPLLPVLNSSLSHSPPLCSKQHHVFHLVVYCTFSLWT